MIGALAHWGYCGSVIASQGRSLPLNRRSRSDAPYPIETFDPEIH
jgi:hypothetical protein